MEDLFDKIYNLYISLLNKLEIGYDISRCDLNEMSDLIQLIYFMKYGHPTESELLWITNHYETIGAFLEDVDLGDDGYGW